MTYYNPTTITQPSLYANQPQQQPQGGGINPMQALNAYSKFSGGEGGLSGVFGGGGAPINQALAMESGTITPAASGGGGSSMGSMASAAGPWAALAAAVMWNEDNAREHGRRPEDRATWAQDAFSGKVLEADADYYGDKVGGIGGDMIKFGGEMGHPEGIFNIGKDWTEKGFDFTKESITNPFSVFEGLGGLFDF